MNGIIEGIVCGKCSHWSPTENKRIQVKHATIEDIKRCPGRQGRRDGQPIPAQFVKAANRGYQQALVDPAASFAADFGPKSSAGGGDPKGTFAVAPAANAWAEVRRLQATLPNLKRMHYAIQVVDFERSSEPVWKFYRVEKPQKGRWAGRTFVSVQASDDFHAVRSPESLEAVLTVIAKDPEKAAADYGHQIGKCGICSRTLTDPESIARGIGPVCADKAGW